MGTTSIEKSEVIADLLGKPQKMNEYLMAKISNCLEHIKKRSLQGQSIEALKKCFERPGLIDTAKFEEICQQVEKEFAKGQEEFLDRCYSILKTVKVVNSIRKGIPHHVLNAKYHEKEAMIVAQAGRKGAVTVATNMAGRGTDILLGGNPEYFAREKLAKEKSHDDPEFEIKLKELTQKMKVETDSEHDEVVKLGWTAYYWYRAPRGAPY